MFFLLAHMFTTYCSMHSTVAISSSGKSLIRYKKSVHSEEYYQEDRIKSEEYKKWGQIRDISLISGTVPENPGRMVTLCCSCTTCTVNVMQ